MFDLINKQIKVKSNPLFGIGYNNFNYVGFNEYGVNLPPAHSIYWLTLAELGYLGFIFLFLIFFYFILKGFIFAVSKNNSKIMKLVVAGLVIALLGGLFQGYYEAIMRMTPLMYLIFIYFAYIAKAKKIYKNNNKI